MFFPIRTDTPTRRRPWTNWLLIAANVVAFLAQGVIGDARAILLLDPDGLRLGQFFTYQFLHADPLHLLGNMLFLYIFGNNVNDRLGHVGYLAFYLAGGVFAGVGHLLASTSPVLGASGSVAAVTGAYLVLFPRSYVTVVYLFIFIGTFQISSLYLIGFFFIKDVLLNFLGQHSGVAHMAHVAGTIFGFSITMLLLIGGLLERSLYDLRALLDRWNRRREYRTEVAAGWNPFHPAPAARRGWGGGAGSDEPEAPLTPQQRRAIDLRTAIAEAFAQHRPEVAARLYVDLKQVDAQQVLPRQQQLDIATHMAGQQLYPQAAEAYESFLGAYPNYEQAHKVHLMLGLIYARYLHQYERAHRYLTLAVDRLHGGSETELAREELARIEPHMARS